MVTVAGCCSAALAKIPAGRACRPVLLAMVTVRSAMVCFLSSAAGAAGWIWSLRRWAATAGGEGGLRRRAATGRGDGGGGAGVEAAGGAGPVRSLGCGVPVRGRAGVGFGGLARPAGP